MKEILKSIEEYGGLRAMARAEPSYEKEYLKDADAKLKEIKKLLLCGTPKRNTPLTWSKSRYERMGRRIAAKQVGAAESLG